MKKERVSRAHHIGLSENSQRADGPQVGKDWTEAAGAVPAPLGPLGRLG